MLIIRFFNICRVVHFPTTFITFLLKIKCIKHLLRDRNWVVDGEFFCKTTMS